METLIAYFAAILIGILLGIMGGGGSILTIPVLVYLLQIEPVLATSYSLFIVGVSAFVASVYNYRNKLIDFEVTFVFSIPAFIGVFISRKWLLPALPNTLFFFDEQAVSKGVGIMILFSVIMFMAAVSMIRNNVQEKHLTVLKYKYPLILIEGVLVGLFTGIVGAGGGFLIVPALVVLAQMPVKTAIGTSLLIIAIKSLFGFFGDFSYLPINWYFLLLFSLFTVLGILCGVYLSRFIPSKNLKQAFGWFILIISVLIITKEFIELKK
ncbi:MAG: sulfite exporter TauE/SafE family protein [Flavobacteriales bacterium]|nr:sulfite exporter TauE/SafE family protein [Flavobacteriales bacterium]